MSDAEEAGRVRPDYRLLRPADVERATAVLSQAFAEDPLCAFMLPSARTRVRTLATFFRAYCTVGVKNGRGYGTGDPLQGIAFWQFPVQERMSISITSLALFIPLLLTSYPVGHIRARAIFAQQEALHARYGREPHFYLDNLGVLPAAQGQGWSSRLIRPFLAMADAQQVIAYTETVTPANVGLYAHFGFECVAEQVIAGTGITIWALRRPPHSG